MPIIGTKVQTWVKIYQTEILIWQELIWKKIRKRIPKEIVTTKLKRGEIIARKSGRGVAVLKWEDRRDVLMITTKHGITIT